MKKSDTKIIIIDDLLEKDDPLLIKLQEAYSIVKLFNSPKKALKYISENLSSKVIVLLDIKFPQSDPDGHEILDNIRDMSFLIPVILWSAIDEKESEFSDFINNKAFAYVKQTAPLSKILQVIKDAENHIDSSIDGAIQEWINLKDKKERDKPYLITAYGKQYTLNQILGEIRQQTDFGMKIKKDLIMLIIDLLLRGKKEIK